MTFKHLESASKKIDSAVNNAVAILKGIEAATFAPALPTRPAEIAMITEIRQALAKMNPDERGKMLHACIERPERFSELTLAAALSGPAFLSGLSEDEREQRRHHWRSKRHAPEMDRIARVTKALRDLDQIAMLTRKFVFGLSDADKIQKALASEAAAKAAAAA